MNRDSLSTGMGSRLGERRTLPERIPAMVVLPASGWRKKKTTEISILIDNVSVSGIGFFVAGDAPLELKQVVEINIEAEVCHVEVRRIDRDASSGWIYYGAGFVGPSEHVLPALERQVLDDEAQARLLRWAQGRGW